VAGDGVILAGGKSKIFGIFTPNVWGFMIQFDGRIFFQMGWFNRQLVLVGFFFAEILLGQTTT